jgi:cyclic pyranopterin phosphate synthase
MDFDRMISPVGGPSGLMDKYTRKIDYLRVSITDMCNLKCGYCVSHTPSPKLPHDDILRYEEILRIVKVAAVHGISKVRITGGEPLVRRNIDSLIARLCDVDGLTDISITTNGVLLKEHLKSFKNSGIKRLNISLDSLKPDRFKWITGGDYFHQVWDAVITALEMGFDPVKINVVALAGINDDEFRAFAGLTLNYPLHIRFIECMPIGNPKLKLQKNILVPEIKKIVSEERPVYPVASAKIPGPATMFQYEGGLGQIGFISPVSNHFCHQCNRLRLTANGQLRPCLLSDAFTDIASPLRAGVSDEVLYSIIKKAVEQKQEKHSLGIQKNIPVQSHMSSIGG